MSNLRFENVIKYGKSQLLLTSITGIPHDRSGTFSRPMNLRIRDGYFSVIDATIAINLAI